MGLCRARGGLIVLVLLLGTGTRVSASEDPEALIRQGIELRRTGDNIRAQGYFARAYQLARTPRSVAQLGLVELALADFSAAEEHLSEALRANDAWVKQNQQTLEMSREHARKQLLKAELVGAPPGATVSVGDRAAPLPADGVLWLPGGTSTVRVAAPGREVVTLTVVGEAGQTRRVDVVLPATSAASGAPSQADPAHPVATLATTGPGGEPAAPGRTFRIAGISAAGVGLVAGVVGVIVLGQGNAKRDAIEAAARDDQRYNPSDGNFATLQQAGVGLMIGGAVAVAGGAALYLVGRRAGMTEATNVSVFFNGGRGGGVLSLGKRF